MSRVGLRKSSGVVTSGRNGRRAAALALLMIGTIGGAAAQEVDCNRLQASIRATESDGRRDPGAFDRAAQQQRYEMDRTRRYAAQLGCDRQDSLFGDSPPPECSDVANRLSRMQDNLDRMQARAGQQQQPDVAGRHAALVARYNAACVGIGGSPANLTQGGDAGLTADDGLNPANLGLTSDPDDLSTVPLNGDIMDGGDERSHVAGRTVCVRTCDGGWFPLAPRATTDQLDGLEQLCKAACPNTEARLYSMRGGELASATAIDGSTYMDLPAAFAFEKSFNPTCTCKPPHQSWAEALAGAEQLLEKTDRHDVTVTTALSDQMAKPGATPLPVGKSKAGRTKPAPLISQPDRRIVEDGLRASQAPTASHQSAGIGEPAKPDRVLGIADGLKITAPGPDGATKRIRLIVP